MLNVDKKTTAKIIDAIACAIDGKPSSAKTFEPSPFGGLSDYGDWGQDTPRTAGALVKGTSWWKSLRATLSSPQRGGHLSRRLSNSWRLKPLNRAVGLPGASSVWL